MHEQGDSAAEVLVEQSDFVATITLNRPERLNAITGPMLSELSQAFLEKRKPEFEGR